MNLKKIILFAFTALTTCFQLSADYPVASHRYLADPSVLVTENRVYVYCSNDDVSPVEGGYNIPNIVCISTSDMKNWTDHGIVFDAARDTSWAVKSWAPSAIERNGKYYLYFGNSGANIGVAVSDSPTGPFRDERGTFLIDHSTPGVQPFQGGWLFDPGVFIDDDGQAYIYFGGNGDDKPRVAKLKENMTELDGDVMKMEALNFFEAAWVFKRNGTYYYSYSTTPKAEMRIDYMTSDHPIEGFEYKGAIAAQPPINNNNNHSGQFEFKGQWYHVYHNRIVAAEAGIPTGFRRNIGLETFTFDTDGNIEEVQYTTNGVEQNEAINPYEGWIQAETFAAQKGIETEHMLTTPGNMMVGSLDEGDWTLIKGIDFGEGETVQTFKAKIKSAEICQNASIELHLNSPEGSLISTCKVDVFSEETGNWQILTSELSHAVTGTHDLYLVYRGNDVTDMKFDEWKLEIN